MPNQVYLGAEGFIQLDYRGPQTHETISRSLAEVQTHIERLRLQGKPVLLLNDLSGVTSQDAGARRAGVEGLRHLNLDRSAIFGGTRFIGHVANLFILAVGQAQVMRYFAARDEAVRWLQQFKRPHRNERDKKNDSNSHE